MAVLSKVGLVILFKTLVFCVQARLPIKPVVGRVAFTLRQSSAHTYIRLCVLPFLLPHLAHLLMPNSDPIRHNNSQYHRAIICPAHGFPGNKACLQLPPGGSRSLRHLWTDVDSVTPMSSTRRRYNHHYNYNHKTGSHGHETHSRARQLRCAGGRRGETLTPRHAVPAPNPAVRGRDSLCLSIAGKRCPRTTGTLAPSGAFARQMALRAALRRPASPAAWQLICSVTNPFQDEAVDEDRICRSERMRSFVRTAYIVVCLEASATSPCASKPNSAINQRTLDLTGVALLVHRSLA
ncbi:hypothetical protein VTK26DRAFT_8772 [Humicola hyalothermophila]